MIFNWKFKIALALLFFSLVVAVWGWFLNVSQIDFTLTKKDFIIEAEKTRIRDARDMASLRKASLEIVDKSVRTRDDHNTSVVKVQDMISLTIMFLFLSFVFLLVAPGGRAGDDALTFRMRKDVGTSANSELY